MIGFDQRGREFQFGTASMYMLVWESISIRSTSYERVMAASLRKVSLTDALERDPVVSSRLDRAAIEALTDPANTSADARIY
jgi:hypothetical protein